MSATEWLGGTAVGLGVACALAYAALRSDPPGVRAPRRTAGLAASAGGAA